jgi:taurine dioxygenase
MTIHKTMMIQPLSGALGAEIAGVDLASPLNESDIHQIRQALLDHLVVVFHDQDITPEQHSTFARHFGDVIPYPYVQSLEGHPDVIPVVKLEHETINFGGLWHSDTTYLEAPPMASILVARELPPVGGDTLFANMYMAYETLSDGMKKMLDSLIVVNSSAKKAVTATRVVNKEARAKEDPTSPREAEHPAVRTHPETGRKALYVNGAHSMRFKNMTDVESSPILKYLFAHQTRPELTCRVHWQPGTIVFLDNRCAQHNPINDYHGHKRILHRITLAGDRPR